MTLTQPYDEKHKWFYYILNGSFGGLWHLLKELDIF
jgi:hypothetical protein